MTMPGDTNRMSRRSSVNRDGEGWGAWPYVVGLAAVVLVLFLLFGPRDRAGTGMAQRTDAPQSRTITPSSPTTSTPGTPPAK
jgi:hypothetical protein